MVIFILFLFAMVPHYGKIYPFDAFNYISTICICQNTIILPVNMLKITNSMYMYWSKAFGQICINDKNFNKDTLEEIVNYYQLKSLLSKKLNRVI